MGLTKVSTDGVKDDAITASKIPANAVGASELADNAVDTNAIVSGTIVDADINSVASIAQSKLNTFVNTNAVHRIITGSATKNTLNGNSNLTYNGVTLSANVAAENGSIARFGLSGQTNNPVLLIKADESDSKITLRAGATTGVYPKIALDMGTVGETIHILNNGKVGIGKDNPVFLLEVKGATNDTIRLGHSGETGSGSHDVKIVAGGSHYQNMHFEGSNIFYKTYNGSSVGERFRIRSTGGVTFNGDTADANALDDYEEGTWTPVIQGTGSNNSKNYVTQTAHYTKVGRLVTVSYRIAWNNKSADSGTAIISGLPFVINESTASGGAFVGNNLNFPANTVVATTETAESQQYVYILVGFDSGTWDNPSTGFFQSSGNIRGQFHYITNA